MVLCHSNVTLLSVFAHRVKLDLPKERVNKTSSEFRFDRVNAMWKFSQCNDHQVNAREEIAKSP